MPLISFKKLCPWLCHQRQLRPYYYFDEALIARDEFLSRVEAHRLIAELAIMDTILASFNKSLGLPIFMLHITIEPAHYWWANEYIGHYKWIRAYGRFTYRFPKNPKLSDLISKDFQLAIDRGSVWAGPPQSTVGVDFNDPSMVETMVDTLWTKSPLTFMP